MKVRKGIRDMEATRVVSAAPRRRPPCLLPLDHPCGREVIPGSPMRHADSGSTISNSSREQRPKALASLIKEENWMSRRPRSATSTCILIHLRRHSEIPRAPLMVPSQLTDSRSQFSAFARNACRDQFVHPRHRLRWSRRARH